MSARPSSAAQAEAAKQGDGRPDHWQESLDQAAQASAPPGKTRAVVLFAASEATLKTEGGEADGSGGQQYPDRHGKHDAVLAVYVPGSEPYAVYKPKFKHKGGKGLPLGGGLPALVSSSDPSDVEILWDELPSLREQTNRTVAEAMQAHPGPHGGDEPADGCGHAAGEPAAGSGWVARSSDAPPSRLDAPGVTPEMKADDAQQREDGRLGCARTIRCAR